MTLLKNNKHSSKFNKKYYLFIFQALFVATLIVIWISSESIRQNKSLWILFLYSFPSEFLIALVPHEPVLIYFGEFYHPLIVALIAVSSTVLTEILN
ncbi:MAG: ribonucleoside triphosphate reductase, partial [bacterium]